MAIGSGAEIGVKFGRWGDMSPAERDLWCATFRERFGDNLLKGYAILAYPPRGEANGYTQEEAHLYYTGETNRERSPETRA